MGKVLSKKMYENMETRFRMKEVKQKMFENEERGQRELLVAEWGWVPTEEQRCPTRP